MKYSILESYWVYNNRFFFRLFHLNTTVNAFLLPIPGFCCRFLLPYLQRRKDPLDNLSAVHELRDAAVAEFRSLYTETKFKILLICSYWTSFLSLFSRNCAFTQEGNRLRPSSVGHLVDHVVHTSPSEVFANHRSPSSTQANSIILESSP